MHSRRENEARDAVVHDLDHLGPKELRIVATFVHFWIVNGTQRGDP